jgi:excinuclease ABC subunit C
LKVLQFVRDETHRFATGFNQRLRSRDIGFSILESVEGIGPKRAAALMKAWGSIEKIALADPDELAEKNKIGNAAAKAVRAAARLALEDREEKKEKLTHGPSTPGRKSTGTSAASLAALAAESGLVDDAAMAAEETPKYEQDDQDFISSQDQ